jgi:hypothetical protein
MGRLFTSALSVALGLALFGCQPKYDHTTFDSVGGNQLAARVDTQLISVAEGGVVTAKITPYNTNGVILPADVVSEDATILEVYHATGDHRFAFLGVKQGTTRVQISASGTVVGVIEAQVVAQPQ